MSLPAMKFDVPGQAYVKQSAMRGQITPVHLYSASYATEWVYSIGTMKPTVDPAHYGERRGFTMQSVRVFAESELLSYCDALTVAIEYHQTQLATLERFKASAGCDNESTAG